jgi:hypothetical protein
MSKVESLSGIIGFFDILGYKSFLVNNEPESAASQVLDAITQVGQVITDYIKKEYPEGATKHSELLKSIQWLVFSDSILITIPVSKNEPSHESIHWIFFLLSCSVLQRHMFEFGLPLRGAISVGNFMIKDNCFVGRPIVEAYQMTEDIDLAATILLPKAYDQLIEVSTKSKKPDVMRDVFINKFITEYYVPLKTSGKLLYTLNFYAHSSPSGQKPKEDLAQMVFETFWKHNKDIPSDVVAKARNTEQYLRFLKFKHPEHFSIK